MVRLERTGQDYFHWGHSVLCSWGQESSRAGKEQLSEFSAEAQEWSRLGQLLLLHGSVTQVLVLKRATVQVRRRPRKSERGSESARVADNSRETRCPSLTHEGTLSLLKWLHMYVCVRLFLLLHLPTYSFTYFTLTFGKGCANKRVQHSTLWPTACEHTHFAAWGNVKPN